MTKRVKVETIDDSVELPIPGELLGVNDLVVRYGYLYRSLSWWKKWLKDQKVRVRQKKGKIEILSEGETSTYLGDLIKSQFGFALKNNVELRSLDLRKMSRSEEIRHERNLERDYALEATMKLRDQAKIINPKQSNRLEKSHGQESSD